MSLRERINTIVDFEAVQRTASNRGARTTSARPSGSREVAALVADGSIEIPIAATYPLEHVRDAYRELAARHSHGKIVLLP